MNLTNFKWDQDSDGIVTLFWDMPGRTLNVLSFAAVAELAQVAETVATDASIKGLILTSGKDNGFCAGADLAEMEAYAGGGSKDAQTAFELMMKLHRGFRRFETGGKPVVAAINGMALGGGLEIALACHYRIVADDPRIRLGFPEAQIGLIPGGGGTQRAPRLVGPGRAAWLMMSATRLTAAEAEEWGLVELVVDDLDEGIARVAGTIAEQSPTALRELKELLRATREGSDYPAELEAFARCAASADGREGIAAFLEKRAPRFTGD